MVIAPPSVLHNLKFHPVRPVEVEPLPRFVIRMAVGGIARRHDTRLGCVHPMRPRDVYPLSARYCVICVVLPEPVSPITTNTWLSLTA